MGPGVGADAPEPQPLPQVLSQARRGTWEARGPGLGAGCSPVLQGAGVFAPPAPGTERRRPGPRSSRRRPGSWLFSVAARVFGVYLFPWPPAMGGWSQPAGPRHTARDPFPLPRWEVRPDSGSKGLSHGSRQRQNASRHFESDADGAVRGLNRLACGVEGPRPPPGLCGRPPPHVCCTASVFGSRCG